MKEIKNTIKHLIKQTGYKIQRADTPMRTLEDGLLYLKNFITPATVIDIGVAHGTPELYEAFPSSQHKYILIEADPIFPLDTLQKK